MSSLEKTLHDVDSEDAGGVDTNTNVLTVVHHIRQDAVGVRRALVAGPPLVLGRGRGELGAGNLDDPLLSRAHCEVKLNDQGVEVRDAGSLNGSFVNGQSFTRTALREGDILGLGNILLLLHRAPRSFTPRPHPRLIGGSAKLSRLLEDVDRVAPRQTTVLVQGETGVGKELIAQEVHLASGRQGRFVAVNCGAMPEALLLSELFGHTRGAFTGADRERTGLVQAAEGGTLFLDEIGEAPPGLQVALLRLLQEQEYRPVGSSQVHKADVRFVAATHRDLSVLVAQGQFREDLFGRLRWALHVPSLRERPEDIPLLARHFVRQHAGRPLDIHRSLMLLMLRYRWPRNVRELDAWIERLCVEQSDADCLRPSDWIQLAVSAQEPSLAAAPVQAAAAAPLTDRSVKPSAESLRQLFFAVNGNVKALAGRLGVSRNTLYRWFKEYEIDPDALRSGGVDGLG